MEGGFFQGKNTGLGRQGPARACHHINFFHLRARSPSSRKRRPGGRMAAFQYGRGLRVRNGRVASSKTDLIGCIFLALALAGTVQATGDQCPATNFTARCNLRNGAGTFVSPDNEFKSCVPKTWWAPVHPNPSSSSMDMAPILAPTPSHASFGAGPVGAPRLSIGPKGCCVGMEAFIFSPFPRPVRA